MKKLLFYFVVFGLPAVAWGQDNSFQNELAGMIQFNSGRVLSLAEAIPAEKYSWSPSEGVRNIGQAMMHIASANYFFGMRLGATLPEGVDPMTVEKSAEGKEEIMAALKKSYDFIMEASKGVPTANLSDQIEFPFGKFSKSSSMMIVMAHCGEHMGQLVAYARMNDITPPWSEKEGE